MICLLFLGFLGCWWNTRSSSRNSSDAKIRLALVTRIVKLAFSSFYYIKYGELQTNVTA